MPFLYFCLLLLISIHALREEGDISINAYKVSDEDFYPRPPRGGRLTEADFYPPIVGISIHALREEGDPKGASAPHAIFYFYPRPPRGGRRKGRGCLFQPGMISIHALREEGDHRKQLQLHLRHLFLSTPSARRATCVDRHRLPSC